MPEPHCKVHKAKLTEVHVEQSSSVQCIGIWTFTEVLQVLSNAACKLLQQQLASPIRSCRGLYERQFQRNEASLT